MLCPLLFLLQNAQLLREVAQLKSKCSELLKSSAAAAGGGGGGSPSGTVQAGGTPPLAAPSGGDDAVGCKGGFEGRVGGAEVKVGEL